MEIVSKTAKASMKAAQVGPDAAKVLSDAERVRLIRIEIASGIYPSCENTHALLREFDDVAGEYACIIMGLVLRVAELETELLAEKKTVEVLAVSTSALLKRAETAEEEVTRLDQLATRLEDRATSAEEGLVLANALNVAAQARIVTLEDPPTLNVASTHYSDNNDKVWHVLDSLEEPLPQPTSEPLPTPMSESPMDGFGN